MRRVSPRIPKDVCQFLGNNFVSVNAGAEHLLTAVPYLVNQAGPEAWGMLSDEEQSFVRRCCFEHLYQNLKPKSAGRQLLVAVRVELEMNSLDSSKVDKDTLLGKLENLSLMHLFAMECSFNEK
jgi:hypothetical protein